MASKQHKYAHPKKSHIGDLRHNLQASINLSTCTTEEVLRRLRSSPQGLTTEEAKERLIRHGPNSIHIEKPVNKWVTGREHFGHPMAILLWLGGIVGWIAQMPQLAIAIWLVNIINGTFSFWQEFQAQKATLALKKLLPSKVRIIRNDIDRDLEAELLVPGDIVLISDGEKIACDLRLLESDSLELDQSTLTGESRPVKKNSLPTVNNHQNKPNKIELPNLLFAGTTVISGHGRGVAIATGITTEFGRIAHLTQSIEGAQSPLQIEMKRVTQRVTILALSVGILIFGLAWFFTKTTLAAAFIFAMGMIVAFVPEGMVPTISLSLALAVQRMARQHALVKKLSAVETLGCTNVICSDKTGTITENSMTVLKLWADFQEADREALTAELLPTRGKVFQDLLQVAVLCNNAQLGADRNTANHGDPMEVALLKAGQLCNLNKDSLEAKLPRLSELAFDSNRKCMSTIHKIGGERLLYLKGSPTQVLEQCQSISQNISQNHETLPLTPELREKITIQIDTYARDGLRVLGAATKNLSPDSGPNATPEMESELTFLGLFAMIDPPRKEVKPAVAKCQKAGIRVVMITGDYEVTAEAIARQIGIISGSNCLVMTGSKLDHTSEQELIEMLAHEVIFARVNPEHKLRIVRAFQHHKMIVAVTGDGVNDAPALKQADIGISMGLSGTDVAREASDMILLTDNFASIVEAIEEGRTVYENIKRFAVYVFTSNMAEAVPFGVMLLSCGFIPLPLTVMQILSIDLGTDMVPAIALGADAPDPSNMMVAPRNIKKPLLDRTLLTKALLWYGLIESAAAMSCYFYANFLHGWPTLPLALYGTPNWHEATTMTLAGVVASQIGAVLTCRTNRTSIFTSKLASNRLITYGIITELTLLFTLMYVPLLQNVFDTSPLNLQELGFAFSWTLIIIALDEMRKWYLRKTEKPAQASA
jgi:calcium-translocating P-type ATPase